MLKHQKARIDLSQIGFVENSSKALDIQKNLKVVKA